MNEWTTVLKIPWSWEQIVSFLVTCKDGPTPSLSTLPRPPAQSRNDTILPVPHFPDLPERLCLYPEVGASGVGGMEEVGERFLKEPVKMAMQGWRSLTSPAWPSPRGLVRLGRKDPSREESPGHRGDGANGTPSQGCGCAEGSSRPFGL